jgi:2-polyprenyl-3-methyl-5-hydroxy-6-metoxy-1,4-benzoquinol methylase
MTEAEHTGALEATGERLIPESYAGQVVLAEHLARYRLATRLASGRRVLDAACGEGYGAAMLAAAGASSVIGVDIDEQTVAHARSRYGLDIRAGDVAKLPFADGEFDLVVSFETIEHVPDPDAAIGEFARVLAPDGLLLASSPNAREYLVENPFHEREMTPEEFVAALEARFPTVRSLYQQNFFASAVLDAQRLARDDLHLWEPLEAAKVVGVEPGRELYMLALCGLGAVPDLDANLAVLASVYEAHEAQRIQREWHARAIEAERIQAEWEARATEAERIQRAWEERATEAERQNAELRAGIDRLARSLSWRLTKPLRAVRGRGR